MSIQILMPALSPTMTEGTLSTWLKKEGDAVEAGDVIAEIETDKATMEVEAVDEGVLGKILVSAGSESVAVNTPIAILLEEGEDASAMDQAAAAAPVTADAPVAAETPAEVPAPSTAPTGEAPSAAAAPETGRVFASPLARRIAALEGIDLSALKGSGPHGRIIKADVEVAKNNPAAATAAAAAPAGPTATAAAVMPQPAAVVTDRPHQVVKLNNMRKTIARRLTESKQTVPHFYLTVDVELDALLALRKTLNVAGEKRGFKLSVNDFVIKASALALKDVPDCNASFNGDSLIVYDVVDISIAVAIDGGLITPIIRDADTKSLSQLSAEMKDLAGRAREGKLKPEEFQGGGFSISNLGMFGVKEFSAVINPPQGAILAVGAGEKRVVVRDGEMAVATVMSCTMSVDHRAIDGALGAQFLQSFKTLIENPMSMLV